MMAAVKIMSNGTQRT